MNNFHESVKEPTDKRKVQEQKLSDWTFLKFKESMVAKDPKMKLWRDCVDAYTGEYFKNTIRPDYKSDATVNMIYSTVEAIRPIMADNNPRFEVLPRNRDGEEFAQKVNKALEYEFDREAMQEKILKALTTALQIGTAIFFLPWDADKGKDGEVKCELINPFNIFPDPLATSEEDAEYFIYATYMHINQLKTAFPTKANLLEGGNINYKELVAGREGVSKTETQVLVLETWCRDYTHIDVETEEDGKKVKKRKRAYPKGRVITTAPDFGVVLQDRENPYDDGKFPFVLLKDMDIPFEFWGAGEVEQLLSPQKYINELTNQIIDNAKTTANAQWVVDKNSGITHGSLTNRPGLIVRKNPGTEVRRESPPPIPSYVQQMVESLKMDLENISGVHDVTQGRKPSGIQAGNAIMALQEAGQSRIRLKIKIMESALTKLAKMWYSRMRQFWIADRWIRTVKEDGTYDFLQINRELLTDDYDIQITSGSTMVKNKSALLDLMIRLGQTQAEDGFPVVDREAILEYAPVTDKQELIDRMKALAEGKMQQEAQMMQQQLQEQNMMLQQQLQQQSEQLIAQVQQIGQGMQQLGQTVQDTAKQVEQIAKEHEAIKEEEKLTDLEADAFKRGAEKVREQYLAEMKQLEVQEAEGEFEIGESGVTDLDMIAMNEQPMLDEELIQMLNGKNPEELQQIMEMFPDLMPMIQQQTNTQQPM